METSILLLQLLLVSSISCFSLTDPERSPPCRTDKDCLDISSSTSLDYRCFYYLCLAWNETQVPEKESSSETACHDDWDCVEGRVCVRHQDKETVNKGFCVLEMREMSDCVDDDDCASDLVCLSPGYCGHSVYRPLIEQLPCQDVSQCWMKRGEQCCQDFTDFSGQPVSEVPRKCCLSSHPVIPPSSLGSNVSEDHLLILGEYGDCVDSTDDDTMNSCRHNLTTIHLSIPELAIESLDNFLYKPLTSGEETESDPNTSTQPSISGLLWALLLGYILY